MSNWFTKHFGITLDSHTLGNLVKNASPVVGTAIGGPLGLAAAGGLSTLGDLGRGKNIGQSLKGAIGNTALAGAGQAGVSALSSHGGLSGLFGGGGASDTAGEIPSAASATPIPGAPTAADFAAPSGGGGSSLGLDSLTPPAPAITPLPASLQTLGGAAPSAGSSFVNSAAPQAGRLSKLLDFAEAHPNTASGALEGLGSIASSGSKNKLLGAQASQEQAQAGLTQNELDQRKASQAALAPYFASLNAQPFTRKAPTANPYLPAVTG